MYCPIAEPGRFENIAEKGAFNNFIAFSILPKYEKSSCPGR